ncbi:MAG: ribbon-helix-helix domain-containing protein [Candidatus Bathyarchaeota archaeon]|nr:ribbon-helix-helix domain-containing protein [Candidatus Bathyarchaeota archaeon]
MVRLKQMGQFRGISLQKELVDEVEKLIEKVPQYRSVAEFISEAVRLRLAVVKSQNKKEAS